MRLLSKRGTISTVAGSNAPPDSGDGGPATAAGLRHPTGLAMAPDGALYIADGKTVRRISPDGTITTAAGSAASDLGDEGPATSAAIGAIAIAVDGAGNLYIADAAHHRIRMVSPAGIITTVAGDGVPGFSGDGGPATAARFGLISGMTIDTAGNLYIADQTYNAVRLLTRVLPEQQ